MRFRIDLKIFLFAILFYFTNQIEAYVTLMILALLHEIGHLIAGILVGMHPEKLEIMPLGFCVSFKLKPKDYNLKIKKGNLLELKKIGVAIAGPLTNFLLSIICIILPIQEITKMQILYANLLLILFNLLPIYPLDGGRIIKGILHIIFGKKKSERYISNISFVIIMILTMISSIAIYVAENIGIFLIIIFLWGLYLKQDIINKRRNKIYDLLEKKY